MADDLSDKTPDAIKKHRPRQTLEMNTPGGRTLQKDMANYVAAQDQERSSGNRSEKYAKVEKESIAKKEHVLEGTRGRLSKEHEKSVGKDMER